MKTLTEEQIDIIVGSLDHLAQAGDRDKVEKALGKLTSSEAVRALLLLNKEQQIRLLELIGPEQAADIVEDVPDEQAAGLVEQLETSSAASILEEMDAADSADIINALDDEDAEGILGQMSPEDAADVRKLSGYAADTAGGLMSTDMFVFHKTDTVGAVLRRATSEDEDFERYRGQHPYIVDDKNRLVGVVSLRTLLTTKRSAALSDVMSKAMSVRAGSSLVTWRTSSTINRFSAFRWSQLPGGLSAWFRARL